MADDDYMPCECQPSAPGAAPDPAPCNDPTCFLRAPADARYRAYLSAHGCTEAAIEALRQVGVDVHVSKVEVTTDDPDALVLRLVQQAKEAGL